MRTINLGYIDLEALTYKVEGDKGQAGKTVQAERLTPEAPDKGGMIVRPLWRHREGNLKWIPRQIESFINYLVKKVTDRQLNEQVTLQNQDPVLNECAARLGVSLRQTEDTLTRKQNIARVKSSLIDLKAEVVLN